VRNWIKKHNVRTSVCDLKMSHIGESPQLVSVYIREEWPPRVCPWGTHFCERVNAYKTIYITRDDDDIVRPTGSGWAGLGLWVKMIYIYFCHLTCAFPLFSLRLVLTSHSFSSPPFCPFGFEWLRTIFEWL